MLAISSQMSALGRGSLNHSPFMCVYQTQELDFLFLLRGYQQIHRFPEDTSLCPVAALTTCCDQVCQHVYWLNVSQYSL